MEESIRFGRIAGIDVGANWSLVVIAWLITWTLAAATLPRFIPDQPTIAYWAAAIVTTVAFFASLLAHELGHSIVARRHGVQVKQITLWLFGGVSKLEGEAHDASSELRIAAIGPGVSFVLGLGFAGAAAGLAAVLGTSLYVIALAWLGYTNLLLAVFNLLPAFPLDGGRVLRATIWARTGDHVVATQRAERVGRVVSYAMIGFGLVLFAAGAGISGLWFVLLGWFVLAAGRSETTAVIQHDLLAGVTVREVMSSDPEVVPAGITVRELIEEHVLGSRFSSYPVVDAGGRPIGIITLEAIRRVPPSDRDHLPVERAAHPLRSIPVVAPDTPVLELLGPLVRSPASRALVAVDGHLVGLVSQTDITCALHRRSLTSSSADRLDAPRPPVGIGAP